mgnify:CR=1 FL=1
MKHRFGFLLLLFASLLAAACGSNREAGGKTHSPPPASSPNGGDQQPAPQADPLKPGPSPQPPQPVNLLLHGNLAQDYADQYIISHVKNKLPHITIKYVTGNIQDHVTAGQVPDLIFNASSALHQLNDLGLLMDMTPLIRAANFDLNRIADGLIDSIKAQSGGKILLMPWGTGNYALYYNKDLFDKFNVPYPKDGITWDEVYDLASRLTRQDGGMEYRGFDFNQNQAIQYNQLSLPYVDPRTNLAAVNTDSWKRYFENFARFSRIPGNEWKSGTSIENEFVKTQTLAMIATSTMFNHLRTAAEQGQPVNFDLATYPVFSDRPGTSLQFVASAFGISPTTKHPEEAFKVVELMMSDEVQKQGAQIVRLTALKSQEVRSFTGKGDPLLESKNLQALYKNDMAPTKEGSKYDAIASAELLNWFKEFRAGNTDVNTVLRQAEEAINKKIAEQIAAGK